MIKFYNEYKSKNLLKEYGLPTGNYMLATDKKHAVKIAEDFGYPIAMKIVSDQIVHKTEAKGIKLNVTDANEVENTYDELIQNAISYNADAVIDGVLVSPMVPSGVEVIIGGLYDIQFGPVVMFGIGGVFVEIFKDVQFRMAPLTKKEAIDLIKSIEAFPMLDGARGKQPVNLDAIADIIVKLGDYMADNSDIKEIDLNPVSCFDNEVLILDASIGVKGDN